MRTTLDLDDELLASLMSRLPGVTKTKAIETAMRVYLATEAAAWMREHAGTIEIEDVSLDRRSDRHL